MANIERTEGATENAPRPLDRKAVVLLAVAALAAAQGGDDDGEYAAVKNKLRGLAERDPMDALLATVLGGGLLFFKAEQGKNPRCNTYWDAVLYVATSLSVGYDDVFPKTDAGHAIATAVHTFGPALAARAFSPPAAKLEVQQQEADRKTEELLAVNKAILARLGQIAAALEAK